MNPILYNPDTKVIATPNADVTPEQQKAAQAQGFTQNVSPVITPASLVPQAPMTVTNPAPATGYASLGGLVQSGIDTTAADQKAAADAKIVADKVATEKTNLDTSRSTIKDLITGAKTKSGLESDAYSTTDATGTSVDTAAAALKDQNAAILAEQTANRHAVDALKQNFTGTTAGLNDAINSLNSKSLSRQADMSVVQYALQGKYDSAKAVADRRVDASLEQQTNELDAAKFDYTENKDSYTKDEQRQYETLLDDRKRALDKKATDEKALSDSKIDLLKSANEQGAPRDVLNAIQSATTREDAINAAGKYGGDQLRRLQIAKAQADLVKAGTENQILSVADAKSLGVPYGTTKGQAAAMGKVPGAASEAGALKVSALDSAKALLDKFKSFDTTALFGLVKENTSPVGNLINWTLPGTKGRDFVIQFNNLKALMSLDNVKYLKGQGQVSDAERRLLEQASAKLDRGQSKAEFESSLNDVIKGLSGPGDTTATTSSAGSEDDQLKAMGYSPEQIQLIKNAK